MTEGIAGHLDVRCMTVTTTSTLKESNQNNLAIVTEMDTELTAKSRAIYAERMFEELYRRAQLFEVTLGGEMPVEGRIDAERVDLESKSREKLAIGIDDEDIGVESKEAGMADLPTDMIERLRIDLSVWKPE